MILALCFAAELYSHSDWYKTPVRSFSVFNSLFLRPVTAANPEQLTGMWIGANNGCSYPNYVDLRDSYIFAGLAGNQFAALNLRSGDQIERVSAQIVTGNFFQVLGVNAALGCTFTADEVKPEREPRVVIASHGFWRRRFRGDPDAVGVTLNLSGQKFALIGVLPQGYRSVEGLGLVPELYLPAGSFPYSGSQQPAELIAAPGGAVATRPHRETDPNGVDSIRPKPRADLSERGQRLQAEPQPRVSPIRVAGDSRQ